MQVDFRQLIGQLLSEDATTHQAARMLLLALDERAVDPLLDVYYAGVSDVEGQALLEVIAEIGGYEALTLLRSVFAFEGHRPPLQHTAALGLLRNIDVLSPDERADVVNFLGNG